ncbi:MAG: DUF1731 domain-containing protein [Deltaproteobacteria bacterium]|nr:DUF1731 domain-containing protein [Deltaproteobacteria bacterium]
MKLVIPGGAGHVGQVVAKAFAGEGHEVVVLSRSPNAVGATGPVRVVAWDGETVGPWARELEGADALLNLAGHTVDCRYTPANRARILSSRVASTRALGEAVARCAQPPRVWLQASTATIYAHTLGAAWDESGVLGGGEPGAPDTWRFSIDVAKRWEAAFEAAPTPHTRKLALRTAMTMSPTRGSVFAVLSRLARFGLGGAVAGGRQFVSWVHGEDFVSALRFLIAHGEISGAVNVASPNPLPYAEFMRALRSAWGMPIGLPATRWMLEMAAFALRTESELVLKSRRVVPGRLLQAGFAFAHPDWPRAAADLVARLRARSH